MQKALIVMTSRGWLVYWVCLCYHAAAFGKDLPGGREGRKVKSG